LDSTSENRLHSRQSAINDNVNKVEISPHGNEMYDLLQFLANIKGHVNKELQQRSSQLRNIKWYVNAQIEMIRTIADGKEEFVIPHFRSKTYIILTAEDPEDNLNAAFQEVHRSLEECIRKGSNWTVHKVICLEINTLQYSPIAGARCMPLPHKISTSHYVLNIKNVHQKCFLLSVLAAIHPVSRDSHPEWVSHYRQYENEPNIKDINYPVSLKKLEKFEKQNNIVYKCFWL
jgi:ribosome-associated translation inhibitor RaiA